jgi:monoamine oxidase
VIVHTSQNKQYEASRLIVTVSWEYCNVVKLFLFRPGQCMAMQFSELGFGSVIKLIFLFREAFWFERKKISGFLLSDEAIPTWWTQLPDQTPILTGWLGGPKAALMSSMSQDKYLKPV